MKIATIVSLAHPFVILIFTAISSYVWVYCPGFVESEGGWLNNPGFHGFSEMLYEYTSSSANNGSGFEGLGDNTYFWNYTCGLALIISRYFTNCRTGCYRRSIGKQEIYSRKCGYIEDRYRYIRCDDILRNRDRSRIVILPCTNIRPDR